MKFIHQVLLILSCLFLTYCNQGKKVAKSFTLQGEIIGQDTGKIVLLYGFFTEYHADTAIVVDGNFSFTGTVKEPTIAYIHLDGDHFNRNDIYLEPGVMNITLNKDNFKDFRLVGSKSQKELDELNMLLESSNNPDSIMLDFVANNPKSYLTPYYLTQLDRYQKISPDSMKFIFNGLDLSIQSSRFGRMVEGAINVHNNTTIGSLATDFKAIDINNEIVTLAQFRGKNVVLLEFWSSWCVPCRQGFPHLKALYNKYNSQGLEIIAIALYDHNRETWESAINEDTLSMWYHVATIFRTAETINEDLCIDYPFGPIPQTILIDKGGRVIGHWIGKSEESEKDLENTLADIIN
jgi:thiol-disulfide isomerase/thioredoxin